jgi:hypothetical protein
MGFKISWVAVKSATKADVLEMAGLRDTVTLDPVCEAPFSCTELPTGWTILFSNDFDYASPERSEAFSARNIVLSCQIHEGVMYSGASFHDHGDHIWSVSHFSENGIMDVSVSGAPPAEFHAIRDNLLAKQSEPQIGPWEVDYVFDVPVELALAICGFRHDRSRFDWGEPRFTVARPG